MEGPAKVMEGVTTADRVVPDEDRSKRGVPVTRYAHSFIFIKVGEVVLI